MIFTLTIEKFKTYLINIIIEKLLVLKYWYLRKYK